MKYWHLLLIYTKIFQANNNYYVLLINDINIFLSSTILRQELGSLKSFSTGLTRAKLRVKYLDFRYICKPELTTIIGHKQFQPGPAW